MELASTGWRKKTGLVTFGFGISYNIDRTVKFLNFLNAQEISVKVMFNMSSVCCDNQGYSLAKLSNNPVDSVLADFVPVCGQNFFQMFNSSNSLPADNLLKQSSDQIVYGIQIRTVRWPIFWFIKVWNVSSEKSNCFS